MAAEAEAKHSEPAGRPSLGRARFTDRVVIVTGAGSGIGRATAEAFHREGATVVVADVNAAEETVAALGDRALAVTTDVSQEDQVARLTDTAVREFGGLDILANVAGIDGELGPFEDCTAENFDRVVAVNLKGVFLGMRYAIPHLRARGGGAIVNVASVAAIVGMPHLAVYSASKGGVAQLTRSTAGEYAREGIRINAVCPGATDTPLLAKLGELQPEAVAAAEAFTPMARRGRSEEIATAITFLASEEASFITGAVIPVDGGMTSW